MVSFTTTILQFAAQGEKTGWTYIEIPADIAEQLKPGNKKSFRVKGKLDKHPIQGVALLPMGGGSFIMALNADMRKAIAKRKGAMLQVQLKEDKIPYQVNKELLECIEDEPAAKEYFNSIPQSWRNYYSKWIESAKTEPTRTKRISIVVTALSKKQNYAEMIRAQQKKRNELS